MGPVQSPVPHRTHDTPRAADYGAVIRHLTLLCQQVESLAAPLACPQPTHSTSPAFLEAQGHRAATPIGTGGGGGPLAGFRGGRGGVGGKRDLRRAGQGVIKVPKLVLVGGQSTGKSSLVECLAGVTLPRSQGTCTRGPLDITITAADHSHPAPNIESSDKNPGWSALVSIILPTSKADLPAAYESCAGCSIKFGDPIDDPALVADRLRRATLAVRDLHNLPTPVKLASTLAADSAVSGEISIPASRYQHMSLAQLEDVEDDQDSPLPTFFPGGARLRLAIQAPGAEPLSFTDLPGLISEGSTFEINAIRNMILRDISEPNTVIVLTASLAMDIRHQNAFSLVKSVDPNGDRTVGILTMPDRMPSGAERQWAKMINESSPGGALNSITPGSTSNGKHFLKHGWHVVRCPAQHEDRANIREIEENFFFPSEAASGPWFETTKMLDVTGENGNEDFVQMRCGLDNLYQHLSHLLLQQIHAAIPNTIASIIHLREELIAEHVNATAISTVDTGLSNGGFSSTFHHAHQPRSAFASGRDYSPMPGRANNNQLHFGHGVSRSGGVEGFDTIMELVRVLEAITKHLYFSKAAVTQELVPYLAHELRLIAPSYLPFTAREARDRAVISLYTPTRWSFEREFASELSSKHSLHHVDAEDSQLHSFANSVGGDLDDFDYPFAFNAPSAQHGPGSGGQVSRSPAPPVRPSAPRKKAITTDDLINALYGDPMSNFYIEFANQLQHNHAALQDKFQAFVQRYTGLCRARLAHLVKNAIPKDIHIKYPQLCMDILTIADNYVQTQLTNEMQRLSARVAVHPPESHGGPFRIDSTVAQREEAELAPRSEYGVWMDTELRLFMMIRMSLFTKRKTDSGDKTFVPEATKIVESAAKIGLVPEDKLEKGVSGSSGGLVRSFAGGGGGAKGRGSTAELDGDGKAATAETGRTVARRKTKAQQAVEARDVYEHKTPSPEVRAGSYEYDDEYIPPPTPTPPTPARKRTPKANSTTPSTVSSSKLPTHDKLAFLSPFLTVINPLMHTALQLMAELRADFNFFSLLVAREAQRIPVSLVQDLQAYLRNSLSGTIRGDLGEEELYKRYFMEADKPRRERVEWIRELQNRVTRISEVVEKLEVVKQQLEMERAASGRGGKWWKKTKSGGKSRSNEQPVPQTEKPVEATVTNAAADVTTPPPKTKKNVTATPTSHTATPTPAELSAKAIQSQSQSQGSATTPIAKKTSPHTPRKTKSMFTSPNSIPTKTSPSQQQSLKTSVTPSKRPLPAEPFTPTRTAPRPTATLAPIVWDPVIDPRLNTERFANFANRSYTYAPSFYAEEFDAPAPADHLHNQPHQSDCEREVPRRGRVWEETERERDTIVIGSSDNEGGR